MAGKTQAEYEELLHVVKDACVQLGYTASPAIVMTDFEVAVIRATTDMLGDSVLHHGCFYHLNKSTLRKA